MIYCTKHISRPVLGRCSDCEELRDKACRRQRFLEIDEKSRQSAIYELELTQIWPFRIVFSWFRDAFQYIKGPTGYRVLLPVFASLVGAYFGLYAVMEARYDRRLNRANFERSAFIELVTSNNRGAVMAAMQNFGPLQTMEVPPEPDIMAPWAWWNKPSRPNEAYLWVWAKYFFPLCIPQLCGYPRDENSKGRGLGMRIYIVEADLRRATLKDVDLHKAFLGRAGLHQCNLQWADLSGADFQQAVLFKTDLTGANLSGANFWEANLSGAILTGANLSGAILYDVKSYTKNQLISAYWDDKTIWPDGFTPPCPQNTFQEPCNLQK